MKWTLWNKKPPDIYIYIYNSFKLDDKTYDEISLIADEGILLGLTFVKKFNMDVVIVVALLFKFPVNATISEFEPNWILLLPIKLVNIFAPYINQNTLLLYNVSMLTMSNFTSIWPPKN